jgi:hypothetical protein
VRFGCTLIPELGKGVLGEGLSQALVLFDSLKEFRVCHS